MDATSSEPKPRSPETTWAQPVSRLHVEDAPSSAFRMNVEGRRVVGALQGFGQLWQKTYRVRLTGCDTPATEVMDIWKRYFPMFQPRDNHFYPSFAGVRPGEMLFFETTLPPFPGFPGVFPFASGVMILYADDESFTVMTPEGFVVAGWNTFSVYEDDDGVPVAQIQSLERATDPIYEIGSRFMGGARKQEQTWFHVLRSLASYLGVEDPEVTLDKVCVDPKVQWRQAKNLMYNGAIRTFFYVLTEPARGVRRRLHARKSAPAEMTPPTIAVTVAPDTPSSRDADYWARPVDRLDTAGIGAGTESINVRGKRVAGALQGFGQLWRKRYRMRLTDTEVTSRDVIATWKEHFPIFWPPGPRFYAPLAGIAPGEVAAIDLFTGAPIPLSTGVMVIYADEESFTYMTPEGHVFAGWITFSAFQDEAGYTVAQAEVLIRASDPLFELAFRLGGSRQEDLFWQQTLRNVGAYFGVQGDVETESICLDPRLQWSRAGNIRHNAAIRSAMYTMMKPARWTRQKLAARR